MDSPHAGLPGVQQHRQGAPDPRGPIPEGSPIFSPGVDDPGRHMDSYGVV